MIKKIKKITTLVNENKKAILRKIVIGAGITAGLAAGVVLAQPKNEDAYLVEGEVVEEETIEITVQ